MVACVQYGILRRCAPQNDTNLMTLAENLGSAYYAPFRAALFVPVLAFVVLVDKGVDTVHDLGHQIDHAVNGVAGGARGDYGYVLVSTMDDVTSIPEIEGVTRVRVIK